jgi:hypothetical protein
VRVLLVVACIAACRPARPDAPFTLRVAVSGPLQPLSAEADPRSWSALAQQWVFEPLASVDAGGDIAPALASQIEVLGPRTVRIRLRAGAVFSDGSPVTLKDVGDSLAHSRLRVTVEADSALVSSDDAAAPAEFLLARAFIARRTGERLVGTGPFVLEEQDAGHLLLRRRQSAPGRIEYVRLDAYPRPQDAFAHTLKGDADLLPDVDPRWLEFFEGVPRLRIVRAPGNHANVVAFNLVRLSRAERIALVRILSSDEVRLMAFGNDCVPPAHRPEIEPLPRGRPLGVVTVPLFDRFALAVRRTLGERGGAVRMVDFQDYFAAIKGGDFDLAPARPLVWPENVAMFNWHTGAPVNVLGYSNSAVDAALDARDWAGAQRAFDADPPAAFVCTLPSMVVLDARIKTGPLTAVFLKSLPEWEVAQ